MIIHTTGKKKGFTLIELSIVLVIIGLIVGGVLVGTELIRNAEFRQISSDAEKYQTAANTFKLKYNCVAGDCIKADVFFGTNCVNTAGTPATGCKGNGNKMVGNGYNERFEPFLFWRHLYLAGMLDQEMPGNELTTTVLPATGIAGENIPQTGLKAGMYISSSVMADASHGNTLYVNRYNSRSLYWQDDSVTPWTTQEIKLFDEKYDDGLASSGRIRGKDRYGGNLCYTGDTYDNGAYCHIAYIKWLP